MARANNNDSAPRTNPFRFPSSVCKPISVIYESLSADITLINHFFSRVSDFTAERGASENKSCREVQLVNVFGTILKYIFECHINLTEEDNDTTEKKPQRNRNCEEFLDQ